MTLHIGTILIAKEDVYTDDTGKKCLIKGNEYKIHTLYEDVFEIESELFEQHEWAIDEIGDYFTIKRYTLSDLQEKKIAVKLRNYEEYKRLCEAVGDENTYEFYFIGDETYYGVIKPGCFIQLNEYELKGRTLVPSIDLIDLEEKEETKEVINEAFYIQKLESEISRLKGENEELKEDNKIKSQLIIEVKYKYIAMTESYENRLMVLQNTNTTLREECDELHNQLELREPQSTPDLTKRERMAWELMLRSVQVENSKHYSLSAEYCLNEVDTFLAKSKEVKP